MTYNFNHSIGDYPLATSNQVPARRAQQVSAVLLAVTQFEAQAKQLTPESQSSFSVLFLDIDDHHVVFTLFCENAPVAHCKLSTAINEHAHSSLYRCDANGVPVHRPCSLTRALYPLIEQALAQLIEQRAIHEIQKATPWGEAWPIACATLDTTPRYSPKSSLIPA